ncbi:hypothetical protein A2U01_0008498 [Trifolium medium]|uniref:Uncharacterized protein n=1 Tax=Trifolium medium TaxID=97028 RepID=A0A392MKC5_9FABA|nr:hypothetical protein [Trifolium medium]
MVLKYDEGEETEEDQPTFKRKRSEPEQVVKDSDKEQSAADMNTDADTNTEIDTVIEGVELATEIHKNKSHEITSLLHHLRKPNLNLQANKVHPYKYLNNIFKITKPNSEPEIPTSETEKIQEVEISQLSESQSSEQHIPKVLTETKITNSEPSTSELPLPEPSISEAPHISNPELAKICNKILDRMKNLHQLRYSFTDLDLYLESWNQLRKDIDEELSRVQNGDFNELIEFQQKTKNWVKEVNKEFETAHLKKKGRLSIPANFFDDTVATSQFWKENLGLLNSDLKMHLKFSLEPKTMFVKKDYVENPAFEAFKSEVKEELSAQKMNLQELKQDQREIRIKQVAMSAKQDEMSADLKAILSILSQK